MNPTHQDRWSAVMMPNYGTPPIALDHGQGVRVWDTDGTEYLDFVGGIAVSALGHAHPALVQAVTDQVGRLAHTSNLVMHEPGLALAERLVELVGQPARVFFANSGAEANECALKLARRFGGPDRPHVVSTDAAFHGRTMGALAVIGTPGKREPFAPLPGPVSFVPFGDADALRAAITPHTAAVIVEPVQGEAGIVLPPAGYLAAVRSACDDAGVLMIVDEVQSGIGRTGSWFASLAQGVVPDVLTLAKGLGGGLPIGACLAFGEYGTLFAPGDHGSTFGGNPVACAAALAVLDTIATDGLLDNVATVGDRLGRSLAGLDGPLVAGTRGVGLWHAVVLTGPYAKDVEAAARAHGLLVNAVQPDVLRLAPPLITNAADVDAAVSRLQTALADTAARLEPAAPNPEASA